MGRRAVIAACAAVLAGVAGVLLGPVLYARFRPVSFAPVTGLEANPYHLKLSWKGDAEIQCQAELTLSSHGVAPSHVTLLLDAGFTVTSLTVNGRAARWAVRDDTLGVIVPHGCADRTLRIDVRYDGAVIDDAASPARVADVSDTLAFDRGSSAWYPTLPGQPFLSGTVALRVPEGFRAVANGDPEFDGQPGNARTEAESTGARPEASSAGGVIYRIPYPTRAFGFALGRYRVVEEMHAGRVFQMWRVRDEPPPRHWLTEFAAILVQFEQWYGPLPQHTFRIVEVPWRELGSVPVSSALGNTVFVPDAELRHPLSPARLAHEVAHFWWDSRIGGSGDAAPLLTQSVAEYSAVMWLEQRRGLAATREWLRYGTDDSFMQRGLAGYAAWTLARGDGESRGRGTGSASELGGPLSMTLGPVLLDSLRWERGFPAYCAAMAALLHRYQGSRPDMHEVAKHLVSVGYGPLAHSLERWLLDPVSVCPLRDPEFLPIRAEGKASSSVMGTGSWQVQDDRQLGGCSLGTLVENQAGDAVVEGLLDLTHPAPRAGVVRWFRAHGAAPMDLAGRDGIEFRVASHRSGRIEAELLTPGGRIHWSDARSIRELKGGAAPSVVRMPLADAAATLVYGVRIWATPSLCDAEGRFKLVVNSVAVY